MLLTGVDFDRAVKVLTKAEEKSVFTKASGLRGELTGLLRDWMTVLPEDINHGTRQLSIARSTSTNPFKSEPQLLRRASFRDVIEACLASCHIHGFQQASRGDLS